ncbi:hypothetical protein [Deinococcus roseus]|uniref:MarR family transcriptional regulator n=1 Tax=Deinococcus roseus TaxID=392414 RepID=A0ABQ2DBH0_9DEIO|nr:hypothetical protein [Deinococcus roseus]GGJ52051.1 hypothetical protein GCM10008938_42570 [Deinococcus roseus]
MTHLEAYQKIMQEIDGWPIQDGIRSSDLTLLQDPLRTALTTTVREGHVTLQEFSGFLGLDLDSTSHVVDALLEHGFLKTSQDTPSGETEYRVHYARSGRQSGDLWNRLKSLEPEQKPAPSQHQQKPED